MNRENVSYSLLQIVIYSSPHPHTADNGSEIIIKKHNGSRLSCNVSASATHCNSNVRRLQGWCIVYAVSCHCYNLAVGFERIYNSELLLWNNPSKNIDVFNVQFQFFIGHLI